MLTFFAQYRKRLASLGLSEKILLVVFLYVVLFACLEIFLMSPPEDFPHYSIVRVEEGSGLSHVADSLHQKHVIRSPFWFKSFAVLLNGSRSVQAGDYYFNEKENVLDVARRIIQGRYGLVPLRITIPEGFSVFQMIPVLQEKFSFFNEEEFLNIAPEGYLFPDTYFFLPNATTGDIVSRMTKNFEDKARPLKIEISTSTITFEEIITIASILEKEAIKEEDKRRIAGVIFNRLKIGMPLQVDATFSYVNGKNSYTLSREDLKDESPYNTYINKGLPPGPIANPGIEAIRAALYPQETKDLYFLSDLKGNVYYAEDFEGHQRNRELYLRK